MPRLPRPLQDLRVTLGAALALQRPHAFDWAPVALAAGIGGYFALLREPGLTALAVAAALALLLAALAERRPLAAPVLCLLALVFLGGLVGAIRAASVAEPVLGFRYYGPVTGRIIEVDRSHSEVPRITLDQVWLSRMDPARVPARVRVSLHGDQGFTELVPGRVVMLTGHLAPPSGPVEPAGFDFRRMAFFERLGAVGYTRTSVLRLSDPPPTLWLKLQRLRLRIAQAATARVAGDPGAFAAAVLTGERSYISVGALEALRRSNLAHLLAISGLHMGMLTGVVFATCWSAMSLSPAFAMRWPTRKLAAAVALSAGGFYLMLSGGSVATQRAFVMVAVMFGAVLLDRRAITLRAVAVAALILLLLRPDTLAAPGFQMSFAATVALVAVFSALRDAPVWPAHGLARGAVALFVSSFVAGLATAPFAAAHFNQIAHYGLVANLLAVPVMGLVVMPGAVLAAVLAPLGGAGLGLWLMGLGARWILFVAQRVSGLEGAVRLVPSPPEGTLPLLAVGALFVILWQGRARWLGLVPLCAAFGLWVTVERPAVLIADDGRLLGLLTSEGRALSKPRGAGFVAESWLENDGDADTQAEAADRLAPDGQGFWQAEKTRFALVSGKRALAALPTTCAAADWVVVADVLEPEQRAGLEAQCHLIDLADLRQTGALALYPEAEAPGGWRVRPTYRPGARRPWQGGQSR
ncbi:ComEC/Rec2 family competence protein [Pseudoruegeria sp. SHC-113]|uniref:ComEC/Rec2 family competence protein n=1 Tax=Pseudoruegeria sp. SHC-113 TaxID=2855439 RepID=UPI0021BA8F3C|nr:ComEC/Rec2 family competence protein [Pseudoruegeria sp. SHC-113]MCT8160799.1 ComEC family competence protein [Pseudoruegeria sp. SHC-113]